MYKQKRKWESEWNNVDGHSVWPRYGLAVNLRVWIEASGSTKLCATPQPFPLGSCHIFPSSLALAAGRLFPAGLQRGLGQKGEAERDRQGEVKGNREQQFQMRSIQKCFSLTLFGLAVHFYKQQCQLLYPRAMVQRPKMVQQVNKDSHKKKKKRYSFPSIVTVNFIPTMRC